jgi:hypothetical protein
MLAPSISPQGLRMLAPSVSPHSFSLFIPPLSCLAHSPPSWHAVGWPCSMRHVQQLKKLGLALQQAAINRLAARCGIALQHAVRAASGLPCLALRTCSKLQMGSLCSTRHVLHSTGLSCSASSAASGTSSSCTVQQAAFKGHA